jgi:hypothetical protein
MWTYVLSDLAGNELAEIQNATSRNVSLGLNRAATSSFTVRPDNPIMAYLFAQDTLLKVYQEKTLRFHGINISQEYVAANDENGTSIRVNAANPAFRLARRILGISAGGKKYEGDKAKSARKMINELNTDTAVYPTNPHTGIKLLPEASYVAGSGIYTAGPYQPALSCINDLGHNLTGFDWYIAPIEGETATVGAWTVPLIGLFEANNAFGKTATNTTFEHGVGQKNVASINFVRDLSDLTNKAFHLPDEGVSAEGAVVLSESNNGSMESRGRYEAVADAFGLTDTALREAWLDEFIRVKHNPRFVVTMTLDVNNGSGRVPQLGTDYWLGDMVEARSVIAGRTLFDGQVRVYGVNIEISETGDDVTTPILLDEEGNELV